MDTCYFYILVIVDNAAMNIGVQILFQENDFVSSGYILLAYMVVLCLIF